MDMVAEAMMYALLRYWVPQFIIIVLALMVGWQVLKRVIRWYVRRREERDREE